MFRRLLPLTVVCSLLATGIARSTTVIPPSFDALVASAGTIFVGEAMNIRSEWEVHLQRPRHHHDCHFPRRRRLEGQCRRRHAT